MNFSTVLDNLEKAVTIAALLIGGVWTYYHFIRGRTYRLRLEPTVSGTMTSVRSGRRLIVTSRLKNVGLSKATIQQAGSALRVLTGAIELGAAQIAAVDWTHIGTFPVFKDHGWVESGETITEQAMFVLPAQKHLPVRLELRIVSDGIEFNVMSIATSDKEGSDEGRRADS
jgi:hypothetical protein